MTASLSIIGGYLGAGKTTLINALLRGALPGRTAVVVNDFGAVNIDADLIASPDGDTISLTNGCICCQISTEMVDTLTALAARGDLEHIVCEVSGVGDPGRMARWRCFPGLTAGPLVVCVDGTSARRLLHDEYVGDVVRAQVAAAEVLLVTKVDLATEAEVADAVAACLETAPSTPIHLGDAADPSTTLREIFAAEVPDIAPAPPAPGGPAAAADHAGLHSSTTVEYREPVDPERLAAHLAVLSGDLVRAKGTVLAADGIRYAVQLAGGRVEVRPHAAREAAGTTSAIVLIAAGPDAAAVAERAAAQLAALTREPARLAP